LESSRTIVTHNDFDGVVSASICSRALGVNRIIFAGPSGITRSQVPIGLEDIVCDLPYPLACGMWFDHHPGNLEELRLRNIDPSSIPGRFALRDSCARVVFEYFSEQIVLPGHFPPMVEEADIIDSFNYRTVEEWRRETPGRIISDSMKAQEPSPRHASRHRQNLVQLLREKPMDEVAARDFVRERFRRYRDDEERMLKLIEASGHFLPGDTEQEIVVLDLTMHSRKPTVAKNLAYILYPQALAVLEVQTRFERGIKTNHLNFSMSLSLRLTGVEHRKDVGEIMRSLNIGDGHAGAAAGTLACRSKAEMLKKKDEILQKILEIWKGQEGQTVPRSKP
jgi:oligoribonuclease NrnB/cAMP/cGMP phosphodiesterase (DHH superfamily)